MLSIGKLGRGQERYYLDKVAEGAEDYYSGEARRLASGSAMRPETSVSKARSAKTSSSRC
jgi:hypothetical protein